MTVQVSTHSATMHRVTDRQTDRQTDRRQYHAKSCSNGRTACTAAVRSAKNSLIHYTGTSLTIIEMTYIKDVIF